MKKEKRIAELFTGLVKGRVERLSIDCGENKYIVLTYEIVGVSPPGKKLYFGGCYKIRTKVIELRLFDLEHGWVDIKKDEINRGKVRTINSSNIDYYIKMQSYKLVTPYSGVFSINRHHIIPDDDIDWGEFK